MVDLRTARRAGYGLLFDFDLISEMKSPPSLPAFAPIPVGELKQVRQLAGEIWPLVYSRLLSAAQIDYMIERMYDPAVLREEVETGGIRYEWILLDSEAAGFLAYGPVRQDHPCTLHKLYLRPAFHGKGIGTRALDHLARQLKAAACPEVTLRVNRRNDRAIRCYQRNGFRQIGTDCLDIGGGFVMDDFLMSRSLHR